MIGETVSGPNLPSNDVYPRFGWHRTADELPPEGLTVETMSRGGQHALLRRSGNLWFLADGSMYVYYTPIAWKQSDADAR